VRCLGVWILRIRRPGTVAWPTLFFFIEAAVPQKGCPRMNKNSKTCRKYAASVVRNPILATLAIATFGYVMGCTSVVARQSAAPSRSVWGGVYTEAQAERGKVIYERACAHCHGKALEGGDMEPSLVGSLFMMTWDGLTLYDLFENVRVSMPQDDPGSLSAQENVDVIAYMLKIGKFPPDKDELATDQASLKDTVILAHKPQGP